MKKYYIVLLVLLIAAISSIPAFACEKHECGVMNDPVFTDNDLFPDFYSTMSARNLFGFNMSFPKFFESHYHSGHSNCKTITEKNVIYIDHSEPTPVKHEKTDNNYDYILAILDILKNVEGRSDVSLSVDNGSVLDFSLDMSLNIHPLGVRVMPYSPEKQFNTSGNEVIVLN